MRNFIKFITIAILSVAMASCGGNSITSEKEDSAQVEQQKQDSIREANERTEAGRIQKEQEEQARIKRISQLPKWIEGEWEYRSEYTYHAYKIQNGKISPMEGNGNCPNWCIYDYEDGYIITPWGKLEIEYETHTIKEKGCDWHYSAKEGELNTAETNLPSWIQGVWHLDIDGPNGAAVSNYVITINGNNATFKDDRTEKYSGPCYVEDGYLYLGTYKRYKINGQSLSFMGHKLTKEGESSSFNGTFRTDTDVMRYLTDRTFYSSNHRMAFTYNSITIDGRAVSGAPRITNFNSKSATIQVSPLGGGRSVYLYLNASNGTINYEGDIFRVR